jgi:DnaK suppressor protein
MRMSYPISCVPTLHGMEAWPVIDSLNKGVLVATRHVDIASHKLLQREPDMKNISPAQNTSITSDFIEEQKKRLEALRMQLLGGEENTTANERQYREEHADEARELEDEAQDMARYEVNQARHDVDRRRLLNIDRALEKIKDGTYGLSDISGKPIPKARLDANPEAVRTIEEDDNKGAGLRAAGDGG